jgi:hypothetical protein
MVGPTLTRAQAPRAGARPEPTRPISSPATWRWSLRPTHTNGPANPRARQDGARWQRPAVRCRQSGRRWRACRKRQPRRSPDHHAPWPGTMRSPAAGRPRRARPPHGRLCGCRHRRRHAVVAVCDGGHAAPSCDVVGVARTAGRVDKTGSRPTRTGASSVTFTRPLVPRTRSLSLGRQVRSRTPNGSGRSQSQTQ